MSTSDKELPPEVVERLTKARAARAAVQAEDPSFFAAVSSAMFRHDLMGINLTYNTDEYDAEAGTVIPRLGECSSSEHLARVLHEEFKAWFGIEMVGEVATYRTLANEIWLLQRARDV